MSLRSQVIKLAYERPELRSDLLPLLRTRIAAGTEDDIRTHLPALEASFRKTAEAIADAQARGLPGDHAGSRALFMRPWADAILAGRKVVAGVLSQRSIPAGKSKALEMVYRLVTNARSVPRDIFIWWGANGKRLEFLIEAAKTWPSKQVGGDELFVLGPFKIHNTVGAKGAELESLKKGLERVVKAVKSNPIPGFSRVLYGDVHVVANLSEGHDAAWYYWNDDSVYLRRAKATGIDEVHALIHELGHRYWHKFASEDQKKAWARRHMEASNQKVEVEFLKPGDKIPVRIMGVEPTITKIDGGMVHYVGYFGGREFQGYLFKKDLKQQTATKNFPTPYSSKN